MVVVVYVKGTKCASLLLILSPSSAAAMLRLARCLSKDRSATEPAVSCVANVPLVVHTWTQDEECVYVCVWKRERETTDSFNLVRLWFVSLICCFHLYRQFFSFLTVGPRGLDSLVCASTFWLCLLRRFRVWHTQTSHPSLEVLPILVCRTPLLPRCSLGYFVVLELHYVNSNNTKRCSNCPTKQTILLNENRNGCRGEKEEKISSNK